MEDNSAKSILKHYKNSTVKEIANEFLDAYILQYEHNKLAEEKATRALIDSGEIMRVLNKYKTDDSSNSYLQRVNSYNNEINFMLANGYSGYEHRNFIGYNSALAKDATEKLLREEQASKETTNSRLTLLSLPAGLVSGITLAEAVNIMNNSNFENSLALGLSAGVFIGLGLYCASINHKKSINDDLTEALEKLEKAHGIALENMRKYARMHPFTLSIDSENKLFVKRVQKNASSFAKQRTVKKRLPSTTEAQR